MSAWSACMEVVQVLGWALLHFVWQAAAIGAIHALLRRCLPRGEARYLIGMLALLALALCPVVTAWHMADAVFAQRGGGLDTVAATFGTAVVQFPAGAMGWRAWLSAVLPWLVLVWSCGVVFLSFRVWRHWRRLKVLVCAAQAVPVWQERLRGLADRFGLRRGVRVLGSARVATPTLVGWIRPVILLPLAVSSGFPAEQVELILAHELAHLRRFDHLANLFQVVLETLLFYHPVVHWISREVRNERELCCDALALRVTGGNRREFATALVELEEFREQHGGLALAARGGVLLERIGHITRPGRQSTIPARQSAWFAGTAAALLVAGLLLSMLWRQAELHQAWSRPDPDVRTLLSTQLLPAPVRMPLQTIANLAPPRLTATPLDSRVRSPIPSGIQADPAPVEPRASKLPLAVPALRIASLAPPRMELAPLAIPHPAASKAPEAPVPTRIVQPVYPLSALEQGIEGRVVVEFGLNADGSVRDPQVVAAKPAGLFDNAAMRALLGWRFAPPAQLESGSRYRQAFAFTLHPASDAAGREIHAKGGCYVVTGSHICRPRSLDEAFSGGLSY